MNNIDRVLLESGYIPSEKEEYMNLKHREYFRNKLLAWKEELQNEMEGALRYLKEEKLNEPDLNDRAAAELDTSFELRTKDRCRKLISKIDQALGRIERDEYGYCEETGEPIGLKRLDARPIATLSIEAQERHEKYERQHNED